MLEWGSRGRKFESSHSDQQKVLYFQGIQDFFFFRFCTQIIDAVCNGCVIEIIYRKAVSQTDSAPSPPSRTRCRRRQCADPAGRRHDPDQAAINDPRPRSDMVRGRLRFDASRKDRSIPDKKIEFYEVFSAPTAFDTFLLRSVLVLRIAATGRRAGNRKYAEQKGDHHGLQEAVLHPLQHAERRR